MNPFLLLISGLILIFLEFYVPGGILGAGGALLVAASVVLFALEASSPLYALFFAAGALGALLLLVKFALWNIKRAKPEKSIFLNADQEGFFASSYDKEAVGKEGTAHTDLRPAGYVLIEGKKHDALSLTGYISKGERVEVVSGEGECLKVIPKKSA